VGDAASQLAERSQFSRLDKLFLFITKLIFSTTDLFCRVTKIPHDVDHGFATLLQAYI